MLKTSPQNEAAAISENIHRDNLLFRATTDNEAQKITHIKNTRGERIVLSFSTMGARIGLIEQTIRSFLDQALTADEIYLVISESPYLNDPKRGVKKEGIPSFIRALESSGKIKIVFTDNIGSYKKIIPLLEKFYNDKKILLITGDDDAIYYYDWILNLYKGSLENENSVIAYRCRHINIENNAIRPYAEWPLINPTSTNINIKKLCPLNIFPTGRSGVLYRPYFFTELVFDRVFLDLSPYADDLWLKFMTLLNHVSTHIVFSNHPNYLNTLYFPDNPTVGKILALQTINLAVNSIEYPVNNDVQVSQIMNFLSKQGLLNITNDTFVSLKTP